MFNLVLPRDRPLKCSTPFLSHASTHRDDVAALAACKTGTPDAAVSWPSRVRSTTTRGRGILRGKDSDEMVVICLFLGDGGPVID